MIALLKVDFFYAHAEFRWLNRTCSRLNMAVLAEHLERFDIRIVEHETLTLPVRFIPCTTDLQSERQEHVSRKCSLLRQRMDVNFATSTRFNVTGSTEFKRMTVAEIFKETYVYAFMRSQTIELPTEGRTAVLMLEVCDSTSQRKRKADGQCEQGSGKRAANVTYSTVRVWIRVCVCVYTDGMLWCHYCGPQTAAIAKCNTQFAIHHRNVASFAGSDRARQKAAGSATHGQPPDSYVSTIAMSSQDLPGSQEPLAVCSGKRHHWDKSSWKNERSQT